MRVNFDKHGSDWVQGNCASRKKQSPIDLNEIFKPPQAEFQYQYSEVSGREVEISNDGRMLSASLVNGSLADVGGLSIDLRGEPTWFQLASIDLKSESEHTIRGKHFPLEIQLVHRPAHYYPKSGGPEAVTVSIFVDCDSPPKAPQVWPGLLQQETRPSKLRGYARAALLQQTPEDSDAMMPEPAGLEADDQVDDPMQQRMDGEINFVHTLVEGEDALAASPAAAPAAAPAGAPGAPGAAEEVYSPPSPMQPDFNPLLQFLVAQEPPDLDNTMNTTIGPDTPLRLGSLLAGGTYFYYWGSSTLPPCAEKNLWLIKREVVRASTEQVKALHSTLHLMSSGAGNYRTGMPLNQRAVPVLTGVEGIPRKLLPVPPNSAEQMTGKEQKYIDVAKDAITIAKAAADYAKDIDWRIQAASTAHLDAMEAPAATTPAPTTSAFIPKPPLDQMWATKIMSKVVKSGIKQVMQANIDELIPATASLATSYLRQKLLKKAGFGPPPLGARIQPPNPIPGVPTFFPPIKYDQPSKQNMSDMADLLRASNCTAANNFSNCGSLTPQQAEMMTDMIAANGADADDDDDDDDADEGTSPEEIARSLPVGVEAVPADWPDPDAWPNGLPPANCPGAGCDPNVWPDPNGARPSGWSDYQWQRYRYNWRIYRSSYVPYRSSYSGYSIHRRRRFSSRRSGRRRSGFSSGRRRSFSRSSSRSSRRRSFGGSSRTSRRRSSSYSSRGRRRR
jgi:carbonic anhydrase